jgi:phospholipase C
LQENRSFDTYFGRMGQYRRDRGFTDPIDDLPLNATIPDARGLALQPFHQPTVCTEDLDPGWNSTHLAVDGGKMDRFAIVAQQQIPSGKDPGGTRVMGYYDWNDLPYYYDLAFQFATSDRWFSSVLSRTPPNRMYMFSATSFGNVYPASPPSSAITIFDRLDQAGISWRYYTLGNFAELSNWSVGQRDSAKIVSIDRYFEDIQNESTMPQVVFIERSNSGDEHPGNNIQRGAALVKGLIDALMQSPTWQSSVFILSYDEPGGLYDHVPPVAMPAPDSIAPKLGPGDQPGDFRTSGLRVPVIVVSPWVKPHFVSHVARDHTSILKFIETHFNLQPLTNRDGGADNMLEFFDFSSPAWKIPPSLPSQPTGGTCDSSLEKAPGH